MAGWFSNTTTTRPVLPGATSYVDPREAALIASSDALRDRALQTSSSLKQLDQVLLSQSSSSMARSTAVALTGRELSRNLKTIGSLDQQLATAMGNSPTYQTLTQSAAGKAFFGTAQATARVIGPVADTAGAIADLSQAQVQAAQDFASMQKVLGDPLASPALKISATAKAAQSASLVVRQQQAALQAIEAADANYLQNPAYQQLTAGIRQSSAWGFLGRFNTQYLSKAVNVATVVGTGAGVVAGVFAMPKMAESIHTNYVHLHALMNDPHASDNQRLDAVADLSRSAAGTIQSAQGIRLGVSGLMDLGETSSFWGPAIDKLRSIDAIATPASWLTRVLKVLSPLADLGMLLADTVKLRTVFHDPKATFGAKFRAVLCLGLDGLKIGSWLMPQTAALRVAYMAASFAQMGVAAWDFGASFHKKASGQATVNATSVQPGNPMTAAGKAVVNGTTGAVSTASHMVGAAASSLAWGVAHPLQAIEAIRARARMAFSSAHEVGGVLKESASLVKKSTQGAVSTDPSGTTPAAPTGTTPQPLATGAAA